MKKLILLVTLVLAQQSQAMTISCQDSITGQYLIQLFKKTPTSGLVSVKYGLGTANGIYKLGKHGPGTRLTGFDILQIQAKVAKPNGGAYQSLVIGLTGKQAYNGGWLGSGNGVLSVADDITGTVVNQTILLDCKEISLKTSR